MRMQLHFLLMMETNVDGSTLTFRLSATFQSFHLLQKPISFLKKKRSAPSLPFPRRVHSLNPIQDGGQKDPPTSFSPATSTNIGFGPQNFLTFSCNPFATPVENFKLVPNTSPKLLNLNQDHPSKKAIFLVKSL